MTTPDSLAGEWSLRLHADGTADVRPPASYPGVLSATLFSSTATTFRTTLFQQDTCSTAGIGSYTWRRTPTGIAFEVASDSCEARRAFFNRQSVVPVNQAGTWRL